MRVRRQAMALGLMLLLPLDLAAQSLVPRLRPDANEAARPAANASLVPRRAPSPATSAAPRSAQTAVPYVKPRLRPEPRRDWSKPAAAATERSDDRTQAEPSQQARRSGGGFLGLFKNQNLRKTSVCGDVALQGEKVGKVGNGSGRGCGITDAVRIRSVSGVALSTPAVINCDTAHALKRWVEEGAIPASKRMGRLETMRVAASYACRTRNHRKGARLSEHAKGNAIDISAFRMQSGQTITVLQGWSGGEQGRMLKRMWKSACGPFGTVLGPNADRYHRDHFHFDVARYRNGPYCR